MLTIDSDLTWQDMLLDFGVAEAESRCAPYISLGTLERVKRGDSLTSDERIALIGVIAQIRQPILTFGIGPPTTWHAAAMSADEIGTIRLLTLMPAATIADLLTMDTPYTRRDYTPSTVRGRPILVGPTQRGPWTLIEGTHRLCGMMKTGHTAPAEVIVGVCPTVTTWHLWRALA